MIGSEDMVSDEIGLAWLLLCVFGCGREKLRRGRNMSQKSKRVHISLAPIALFLY